MTRDMLRLMRWRKRVFECCKKYPTHENIQLEARFKAEVKTEVLRAKKDLLKGHVSEQLEHGNSKPLFNFISRLRGQANQISSLENTLKEQIAEKLAKLFSSVFSISDGHFPGFEPKTFPHKMADFQIATNGNTQLIKGLDKRKASGPDNISTYLLNEFSANVTDFVDGVVILLNESLATSDIPDDWKKANICPVFKSGRRDQPGNYRPASPIPNCSKII